MGAKLSKQRSGDVGGIGRQDKFLSFVSVADYIRNLVSKKRRRLVVAGFDLDMSYITDRLVAMSFPAEHMRAIYRNPLWQVKKVLEMLHAGHYKVYNLCIEESYDPAHFHGCVEVFPFDDHHVPPLSMMKLFCESVHSWLSSDPQNVAVIHCKAGKGRTGLMVCAYLVYTGMSVDEALQLYADRRTTNNEGVSNASQRRYVGYWAKVLSFPIGTGLGPPEVHLFPAKRRELRRIRLYDTVKISSVLFVVSELGEVPSQMYRPAVEIALNYCRPLKRTSSPRFHLSFLDKDEDERKIDQERPHIVMQINTESSVSCNKPCLDYYFEYPLQVAGDIRVIFYGNSIGGKLFYACFNTAFITNNLLQFSQQDLDKVGRKGKSICGPDFCVKLFFGPEVQNPGLPWKENAEDSFQPIFKDPGLPWKENAEDSFQPYVKTNNSVSEPN